METRTCTKCREAKPVEAFRLRPSGAARQSWCKGCSAAAAAASGKKARARPGYVEALQVRRNTPEAVAKRKAYNLANREKHKAWKVAYYQANKAERVASSQRWADANRAKVRLYMRAYQAELRANTPGRRLSDSISAQMNACLKRRGTAKAGRSWEALVGYTLAELERHLERLFAKGMTWENLGRDGWHIDHRLPLSGFDFADAHDPEFRRAWALANLQPLWQADNLRKGAKRLTLL
jgi:hypothetical protein